MRLRLHKLKLQQDVDRIKMLHWGHYCFVILSLLIKIQNGIEIFGGILSIIIFSLLYRTYYKTAKNIYYTYWTFSFVLLFYLLIALVENSIYYQIDGLRHSYIIAIVLLSIESYILSSPIYFPKVRWWEYDYRYRNDLQIKATYKRKKVEGRLTDVRRLAGCVVLFESVKVGDSFDIEVIEEEYKALKLHAEVMSKREYSIGRGYTYGVKFSFDDVHQKKEFTDLSRNWQSDRVAKAKLKFKNI